MTDIVYGLRMQQTSRIANEAADEIERLQLREETLSGIIDGMTARFIEAQGAVEEIERLRKDKAELVEELWGIALHSGSREASEMARAAIAKATGGE